MSRQQSLELKIKTDREIALKAGRRLVKCDPGDEVVITGFSGSFPNSDGLLDFADKLFNKVDLISDDDRRWTIGKRRNRAAASVEFVNAYAENVRLQIALKTQWRTFAAKRLYILYSIFLSVYNFV